MKIQYLSLNKMDYEHIEWHPLAEPQAFDSFDINVIDLSHRDLWRCDDLQIKTVSTKQELNLLRNIIYLSKRKNVVVLLPQDCNIYYDLRPSYQTRRLTYQRSISLKTILPYLSRNLREIAGNVLFEFGFENNKCLINGQTFDSSFFFLEDTGTEVIHKAIDSEKAITIKRDGVIYSFLDVRGESDLFLFLKDIGVMKDSVIPSWLADFSALNDEIIKRDIEEHRSQIEKLSQIIERDLSELSDNNYYKQILFVNGPDLVERVFRILDDMLKIDLANTFVDYKREDFLFKHDGITYIGEIKGVTKNVKNEHISQVDDHLSIYEDQLQEEGKTEALKKLLIINHQRNRDIISREPIHINQIKKAEKENVLIIETLTLLRLYEKFRDGQTDTESIYKLFSQKVGKLTIDG